MGEFPVNGADPDPSKNVSNQVLRGDRECFVDTILRLGETGIGTPSSSLMASFYEGLSFYNQISPVLLDKMVTARAQREGTNRPISIQNMLFVSAYATNYAMMFAQGYEDYPNKFGLQMPGNWVHVFSEIENDPALFETFHQLLLEKELITSVPARGNNLRPIVRRVFGERSLRFTDLGASMGFPPLSATQDRGDSFPSVIDDTEYRGKSGLINAERDRPLVASRLVLVDHTNPFRNLKWFLSCCYPGDANTVGVARSMADLKRYPRDDIEFVEGDMLAPPPSVGDADVLTLIKSGYELDSGRQKHLIGTVMSSLINPHGIMIVTDNVVVTPTGELVFTDDRSQYSCVTAVRGVATTGRWMVVFEHLTGRCDRTRNGPDIDAFMEATSCLPHNMR